METNSQLYWTLLEPDLTSTDLYFPADTPVGKANPKRHYNILKKRQVRQRERLINQQVCELEEYQKNFSIEHREDLFIKLTVTVCEPVSGSEFLTSHDDMISELLATIPDQIIQNQVAKKSIEKKKELENRDSSTRQQEYLDILKKKYDAKFGMINKAHQLQWETLLELQANEMSVIPKEFQDPSPHSNHNNRDRSNRQHYESSSSSPPQPSERYSRSFPSNSVGSISPPQKRVVDYDDNYSKSKKLENKDIGSHQKTPDRGNNREYSSASNGKLASSTSILPPGTKPSILSTTSGTTSSEKSTPILPPGDRRPPIVISSGTNGRSALPAVGTASSYSNSQVRPSPVGAANNYFTPPGRRLPTVGTASNAHGRPPMVGTVSNVGIPPGGRPPTVGTASNIGIPPGGRPATVGTSSSSFNNSNTNNRRDSVPLFSNKPINHNVVSLLDRGTLSIQNKPSRVIIRGPSGTSTNYGDPKDYDDAINSSVERPDNPVYKRHTQGQDYLFYKTESGKVVTIGPVSKIQPLIHKFFLSM